VIVPRVFWVALGAGAGILLVRRARLAARAITPAGLADRAGATAEGVSERAGSFIATVRGYAAEREAELRAALGLDEPDADTLPPPGSGSRP